MRRKDREIKDPAAVDAILQTAKVCRVAFYDTDTAAPYIVPLNHGYEWLEGENGERRLRLVCHGARAGRKYQLLLQSPLVGFEMDCAHALIAGDTACEHSFAYQSIVGTGSARLVEEPSAKRYAIDLLMTCQAGRSFPIEENVLARTAIFEILADEYSAKGH